MGICTTSAESAVLWEMNYIYITPPGRDIHHVWEWICMPAHQWDLQH